MQSSTLTLIVIAAAVVLLGVVLWAALQRRRTNTLRNRFGDEYDRTVEAAGKRAEAEAKLEEREDRVAKLDIRPLDPREREAAIADWRDVKALFVDSPVEAVHRADRMMGAPIAASSGSSPAAARWRASSISWPQKEIAAAATLACMRRTSSTRPSLTSGSQMSGISRSTGRSGRYA